MEEVEAVLFPCRVAGVQGFDSRLGRLQDGRPLASRADGRIGEIPENGEVNVRIQVAEGEHLEMLDQTVRLGDVSQQRGNDHHRPR
jgi:hypothetical protein